MYGVMVPLKLGMHVSTLHPVEELSPQLRHLMDTGSNGQTHISIREKHCLLKPFSVINYQNGEIV